MTTAVRRAAALSLAILLSACGTAEPPPDHFYRLEVAPAATTQDKPLLSGLIEVAPLLADGLVNDRAVVYVYADEPFELRQYNYQFWNSPPATLVQEQLIRFLRSAGVADRVVSTDLRLPVDYAIEGRVRRFEQVFGKGAAAMNVELEFAAIRVRDENLVLLKTYRSDKPAVDDSLPAAALAATEALSEIFYALLADLKAAGSKKP